MFEYLSDLGSSKRNSPLRLHAGDNAPVAESEYDLYIVKTSLHDRSSIRPQAAKHLAARSIDNPFKDFETQAIAGQDQ